MLHKYRQPRDWRTALILIVFYAVITTIALACVRLEQRRIPADISRGGTSSWSSSYRPHIDDGKIYVTNTGECYHRSWCSSLDHSKIEIELDDALEKGYRPCGRCHPPVE